MEVTVKDGTGTGRTMKIDDNNRIAALSVGQSISEAAGQEGDTYNYNTGIITLTTANKSAVAYLANNSSDNLAIQSVGFMFGNSAGGSGDLIANITKNPKSGSIITNAVPVKIFENKNAASSRNFNISDVPRYKGAEGDDITDGTDWYESILSGAARPYVIGTGDLIIAAGTSIAIEVTPPAGNTSMNMLCFMAIVDLVTVLK
jgi:hypothetical protein